MAFYQKKPVVVEAVQLQRNNIEEVYRFVNQLSDDHDIHNRSSWTAEEKWEDYCAMICRDGFQLKTKESGQGVQIASVGDYIVKGFTQELGWHFWPVKPSYFEENYFEVPEPIAQ
ncbi:hypothetical protein BWI93_05345 [Siphonobacter sp. BAB-5385]|uniref:hypothetical protein n=1 Tax=Siphonobacter sp. BAB-5385 TaxID=1864822 RepID=UPI000B9DE82E|nr:hypothetical protein [Siphonobacter sp. BAB-5385]OZI09172.1 hypothetical protein BWI93_05345 [Siphonobacter sp. BAB-5385]